MALIRHAPPAMAGALDSTISSAPAELTGRPLYCPTVTLVVVAQATSPDKTTRVGPEVLGTA
ncbi:MAG TPA: hypothetical protein VNJ04_17575, partial [Gemmatimonadaceae bacterium]|nr:hypothetical protein [Gemmatimonadaceae bacterium]